MWPTTTAAASRNRCVAGVVAGLVVLGEVAGLVLELPGVLDGTVVSNDDGGAGVSGVVAFEFPDCEPPPRFELQQEPDDPLLPLLPLLPSDSSQLMGSAGSACLVMSKCWSRSEKSTSPR